MSLTKEDLQAISELMDGKLDPINTRLEKMDSRLDNIEQRVIKIEITQENIVAPNIKLAYEGIGGINDRLGKLDKIEAKQEDHDNRIWALEQVVKAK